MSVFSSVITENGVTSEPVPAEVAIHHKSALMPSFGKSTIRFLISMKVMAKSIKLTSGYS